MEEWQKIAEGNTAEIFLFSHEKGVKQFKCGYSQKSSSGQIQRQADKAASYSHVICLSKSGKRALVFLFHNHFFVGWQRLKRCRRQGLVPISNRGIIVIPRSGPAKVIQGHPEAFVKVYRVIYVPAIQQESLLTVILLIPVIAQDGKHTRIVTAESLVLVEDNIIAESIGTAEVVFRAGIMDGGVLVVIYVHSGFTLDPTGVVAVHS